MKKSSRIAVRLSFKYMALVASVTFFLSAAVFAALFIYVKSVRTQNLKGSCETIAQVLQTGSPEQIDFAELPYFIVYAVFEKETKKILATNDALLPLLDIRTEKLTEYTDREIYSDGELKIALYSTQMLFRGRTIVIECAMDIENDSLSKMMRTFPKILIFCVIPVFLVSFFISFVISRKTISAFKKLESAFEKEKSFSANVSHELKTPLAVIDGHANLIKRRGRMQPEEVEKSVDVILEETAAMTGIIGTLLELSKIENSQIEVHKKTFFVSNLFARIRDEFLLIHKNLKIRIEDDGFAEIESDEKILHQILTALVSNSVKFAGEESTVTLRCTKNSGRTQIEVQDDGKGFEEATLPFVFERFYKGDKSHTRNKSGSGLGLSIARALTDILGGKIEAQNDRAGGALVRMIF
jgi:signal transduction histidine kinase